MRTFIAVKPTDSLLDKLSAYCRDTLTPVCPGVRWVSKQNLHLTLRFLGEISPDSLDNLRESAQGAASQCAAFELYAERIGFFGSPRSPRVIWLGLKKSEELQRLASNLETALGKAGFGRADKPFQAHLTLARIKKPLGSAVDWRSLPPFNHPAPWPVTGIEIISSTLTPGGPIYETLDTLTLSR